MGLVADILLIAAALGAGFYCIVLSRRLTRFTDLEKGVGGAIAVLSVQVDDMTKALEAAQNSASQSATSLGALTGRAEDAARKLELLVASMHDLPPVPEPPKTGRQAEREAAEDAFEAADPLFSSSRQTARDRTR
ncbi:MAG: hypothetical protein AAFR35_13425 [Pseudomonadota bacterium]